MLPETSEWFARRTWHRPGWTVGELVAAKGERRIAVVLPALNEEPTVGGVVASVLPLTGSLVDDCVVIDSGSADATPEVARAAGARVLNRGDALPGVPVAAGKGEVLWRSLAAVRADIVVFLDSDLVDPDPGYVPALVGPLLTDPAIHLVKGFYRRPLRLESAAYGTGGGRVTELLARPLLGAMRPTLAGVIQPLGGEYAVTTEFARSVPFAAGYGVEIGLLLDAHTRYGLDGIAQVNLGVRKHRNRNLQQLGVMARQILGAALQRCGIPVPDEAMFAQFAQVGGEWLPHEHLVALTSRPPMREVLAADTS
jgi:glucosyl-3-phosphoglycerate synthase